MITRATIVITCAASTAFGLAACSDEGVPAASATARPNADATTDGMSRMSEASPTASVDRQHEAALGAEWTDRWLSCMRDLGFTVTIGDDGGYSFEGGSADAISASVAACNERAGPEVTYAPITPEEASHQYDLELAAKACLEEQGLAVSEPPSREEYIDRVLASNGRTGAVDGGPWQAFMSVHGDWIRWEKVCPLPSLWGPS